MWTEIAKHLCGYDLVCLSLTCHWFHCLLADDSIWRHTFICDFHSPSLTRLLLARNTAPGAASTLPPSMAPTRTATTRGNIAGGVADGGIPGGHTVPAADREAAVAEVRAGRSTAPIEMMGTGVLRNARPGIWIADRHLVQCPRCNVHMCSGSGRTALCSIPAAIACCAVFNHNSLSLSYAEVVRHTKYWIRKRHDWRPKGCLTPYAAAINTNLHGNGGLLSKFQVMCDMTGDGRIVSIRITQQLF
ncbi:hypothetical protein QOZ80_1AG0007050 [Eleusine coracana subsp. coracana]|nr:hypothetical protein QOZ80_1AG0007050 [Eleusine coracana subsp. coracana]